MPEKRVMIFNGGEPLADCPTDFNVANAWADQKNEHRENQPIWKFDCGFKLDFDGPVVSLSSRFFPPKTYYGDKWDGTLTVMIGEDEIKAFKFECENLEQLAIAVEAKEKEITDKFKAFASTL